MDEEDCLLVRETMDQDKWNVIAGKIKEMCVVEEDTTGELDDRPGNYWRIIFTSPAGRIKLERTRAAKKMGEHTSYSNRIGSDVVIEKKFSEDEFVEYINAWKWNESTDEWDELDQDTVSAML